MSAKWQTYFSHMSATCQQNVSYILVAYNPHFSYILAICQSYSIYQSHVPLFSHIISSTYHSHVSQMPATFLPTFSLSDTSKPQTATCQSHSSHISATFQPHASCNSATFWPHVSNKSAIYQPHVGHLSTTCQPHQVYFLNFAKN
jgi:hypothetical protein